MPCFSPFSSSQSPRNLGKNPSLASTRALMLSTRETMSPTRDLRPFLGEKTWENGGCRKDFMGKLWKSWENEGFHGKSGNIIRSSWWFPADVGNWEFMGDWPGRASYENWCIRGFCCFFFGCEVAWVSGLVKLVNIAMERSTINGRTVNHL